MELVEFVEFEEFKEGIFMNIAVKKRSYFWFFFGIFCGLLETQALMRETNTAPMNALHTILMIFGVFNGAINMNMEHVAPIDEKFVHPASR